MHIDLPVHEAAADDELLDAVDALLVDHELVVVDVEHGDDAVGADDALADAGEEAVAAEVVEAVHVELAADELVEEVFGVGVAEDGDSHVERGGDLGGAGVAHLFHHHEGQPLVVDVDQDALGGVGEGAVADVVEEDGEPGGAALVVGDPGALETQGVEGAAHEVEGAEHVGEAGVHGAGVDEVGEAELLDATLALEEGVLDDGEEHGVVDGEEAVVDGVVDDLAFVGHG